MKTNSLEGKADPKMHVRKKVAGGATGAMLGAVVAGPIGAIVGGTVGTMIGSAAERGTLEMPKRMSKRSTGTKVKARARGSMTAKRSVRSVRSADAKKSSVPRSKRAAGKARSKK